MSYTPPKTRTKDDAFKELKEIELKINAEKDKLFVAVKERENAEAGFVAREQNANKIVSESKEMVTNLELSIQEKKEEIKEQERIIAENNSEIAKGIKDFNSISANIQSLRKTLDEMNKAAAVTIAEKKELTESLEKEILAKSNCVRILTGDIEKLEQDRNTLEKNRDDINSKLNEREKDLSEREHSLEEKKSAIRTYSVRFHKQFGDKLPERIIKETTVT